MATITNEPTGSLVELTAEESAVILDGFESVSGWLHNIVNSNLQQRIVRMAQEVEAAERMNGAAMVPTQPQALIDLRIKAPGYKNAAVRKAQGGAP